MKEKGGGERKGERVSLSIRIFKTEFCSIRNDVLDYSAVENGILDSNPIYIYTVVINTH